MSNSIILNLANLAITCVFASTVLFDRWASWHWKMPMIALVVLQLALLANNLFN